ncbi:hypothetical protein ACJIZ3_025255 [Penstemon smallii]|uniref:Uncharacterized protein n=1 Tax=Penstemon smallii TaxID=265156 RepID=A0ABD3TU70_9LAMI
MSKKSKGAVLDLKQPYGVGVYEDAKSRLKHQNLMQDYHDLQKDSNVMRSKLETAKQRKLTLAAEVRFLRRRYKYLVETKTMNISQDRKLIQPPNPLEQNKKIKEQLSKRKEASQHRLPPPVPELKAKKRRYIGKEVTLPGTPSVIDKPLKKTLLGRKETIEQRMHHPISVLNHKRRVNINQKERMFSNDFDLNQDSSPVEKGASLLTRAPIFDLNEISTGDEDFQSNVEAVKFEEAKKSMIRGLNDEQQNDLNLSICRNSGEGSSRVGKRKISWQDPVALRV